VRTNERVQRLRRDVHETRRPGLGRGESSEKYRLERKEVQILAPLRGRMQHGETEREEEQDGNGEGFWEAGWHWPLCEEEMSAQGGWTGTGTAPFPK